MEGLKSDLRFALKLLLKNPALNAIAILSLALGIGANTAIFSLTNFLFLRALPHVEEPGSLVKVFNKTRWSDYSSISYPDYKDYRDTNRVFSQLIAYGGESMNLDLGGNPERVLGEMVTGSYFPTLGVKAALGRLISPEDDQPGAPPVAVLSHGLWQRGFGSDPKVLGKSFLLNGNKTLVAGVAPPGFKGLELREKIELWIPIAHATLIYNQGPPPLEARGLGLWRLVGRLRPGVTLEQAAANLTTVAQQIHQQFPNPMGRNPLLVSATEATFSPADRGTVSRLVGLLMAVVGLVLLIACVNIANLMLARTARRRRELSVRQALGADRGRLVRQLLTESVLLALLGATLGLVLADAILPFLARFQLPSEIALDLDLDGRVLGFALALALVTGLLVGLVPALRASRPDLVSAIKDTSDKAAGLGLRGLFVIAQVALCLVLLIGAGLFLKSLQRLLTIDPGMAPQNLATLSVDLGSAGYSEEEGKTFYRQLLERVGNIPGVQAVSLASTLPIAVDSSSVPFFSEEVPEAQEGLKINVNLVGPDYFRAIGLPLLQGRAFTSADSGTPSVCIVNQTLAERFWPGQNPIGKRLRFSGADGELLEVIGVARNGKYNSLREDPQPYVYLSYLQVYELFSTTKHLLVRTAMEPERLFADIRRGVQSLDRSLPVFDARTMESHLATFLAQERQTALLLLLLAGLALLLASIGLYGVMSYSVSQRTREIGIRMALGAGRGDVIKQLIIESARLIIVGSVIGLIAAILATRLVSTLLYSVSPTDTATFVLAFAVLAAVGLAAGFVPARRAASVNPMSAIRYD
jgi:macrolide transport system ATP-binding/permease protein